MLVEKLNFKSVSNEQNRFGMIWSPKNTSAIKAIVQISHGMGEHITRYNEFAAYMAKKGIVVCGTDHEGHGFSVDKSNLGHIDTNKGYINMVNDLHLFTKIVKKKYKSIPYFLLGHSMGSFLARFYATLYQKEINGLILSGTGCGGFFIDYGLFLSKFMLIFMGKNTKATLFANFTDRIFNKSFGPNRTECDWISRDISKVDDFVDDDYCGFAFSYNGYVNLLKIIHRVNEKRWFKEISKDLPIYIFSGSKDPIGNFGKGVKKIYTKLLHEGCTDVNMKLYEGGRHEMLNEINRYEVFQDVHLWVKELI